MRNLLEYAEKHVTVSYRDENGQIATITGRAEKANAMCILVRPKGKAFVLIDADDISSIEAHAAPAPKIKIRSMEKITTENIRQHLADRHGLVLTLIPDDDELAEAMHEEIDHSKLGHVHRPNANEVAERAATLDAVADGDDEDDE